MKVYQLSIISRPEVIIYVAGESEQEAKAHYFDSTNGIMHPKVTEVSLTELSEEEGLKVIETTIQYFKDALKMVDNLSCLQDSKLTAFEKSTVARSFSSIKWGMHLLHLSSKKEDYI